MREFLDDKLEELRFWDVPSEPDQAPEPAPWVNPDPLVPVAELKLVYWEGHWRPKLFDDPGFFGLRLHMELLTPSHLHYLQQEDEGFVLEGKPRDTSLGGPAEERAIGLGEKPCPLCAGAEILKVKCRGKKTGVPVEVPQQCPCVLQRRFYPMWMKRVSDRYQRCTMENIWTEFRDNFNAFSDVEVATLRRLLNKCSDYNMLIVGPAGTAKTTILTALFHRAFLRWVKTGSIIQAVWMRQAAVLADAQTEYATRDRSGDTLTAGSTFPQLITVEQMQVAKQSGLTPCLFLDEFDKYKMSGPFQNAKFHGLIDYVYSEGGQVVVAANLNLRTLRANIGAQCADGMIRRLVGEPKGLYIDLWARKFYVNRREYAWNGKALVRTGNVLDFFPEQKNGIAPASEGSQGKSAATSLTPEASVVKEGETSQPTAPPSNLHVPAKTTPNFKRQGASY